MKHICHRNLNSLKNVDFLMFSWKGEEDYLVQKLSLLLFTYDNCMSSLYENRASNKKNCSDYLTYFTTA